MGRPAEDLTGKKFNNLTVIRRATEEEWPRGAGKHAKWLCKCDCGNLRFVDSGDLKNGRAKSCGCKNREKAKELAYNLGKKNFNDLTGKKFGKLTVIKKSYQKDNKIFWECKCECGTITIVSASNLRSGHTKSCGCGRSWGQGRTSLGEEKIIKLLQQADISFEREKTFPDLLKHGNHLRCDFYIPAQNSVIEFNGSAHYEFNSYFHKDRKGFLKRQEYDRHKISYCLAKGIKIYCIPYWEIEGLTCAADLFQERFRAKTRWKNDVDFSNYQNKI